MRGQKRDLFRRVAAADAPHNRGGPFIGAEGAHERDEFIAAMIGLDGRDSIPPLAAGTMAALAATDQQGRICRLRQGWPA